MRMKVGRIASLTALGVGALYVWRALKRQTNPHTFGGNVVVITGGSRGLGFALAREFAAEGARLVLLARDEAELARACEGVSIGEAEVMTVRCDVRDQAQVEDAIAQVIDHFGRIDVLVNNAGIITVGPQEHMQIEDYQEAMDTHLWGPLYTMRAVFPHMRRRGAGRIVNISSIGGKIPFPHLAPYVTSKFALAGLSQVLGAEFAKDRISITTVYPMTMRTGSHYNVHYKGRRGSEMNWFAVLDALPFTSVDARHAAHLIVEACRNNDPELFIVPPVRFIPALAQLFPSAFASLFSFINQLLPSPTGPPGNRAKIGWEVQAPFAPSALTFLNDRAAQELNELSSHEPVLNPSVTKARKEALSHAE